MNNNEISIIFGLPGKYLSLELNSRAFPDADSDWDRDAIDTTIEVNSGTFKGNYNTMVWSHELLCLQNLILELSKGIKKSQNAIFSFREATLRMTFDLDELGHLYIHFEACDKLSSNSQIEFDIEADQTYLPIWLSEINDALEVFPPQLEVNPTNPLRIE